MSDHKVIKLGSVCSGYGGLELGIGQVIDTDLMWVADYSPPTPKDPRPRQGASMILAHRFPGVPNLGDITTTDWPNTAPVDVICGYAVWGLLRYAPGWVRDRLGIG